MNLFKRLGVAGAMLAVAGASYLAGQRATPPAPPMSAAPSSRAGLIVPASLAKSGDMELAPLADPTGVLLGEAKVPDELLRGPQPAPMQGVIVPQNLRR